MVDERTYANEAQDFLKNKDAPMSVVFYSIFPLPSLKLAAL